MGIRGDGKEKEMRRSEYKRGEFILSRMQHYLLIDLGHGIIDAEQAGYVFDLIIWARRNRQLSNSGVTTDMDLAQNSYYLKALNDYRGYLEIRQQRLKEKFA